MCGIKTTRQPGSSEQHSTSRKDRKDGDLFKNYLFIVYVCLHVHALACMWKSEVRGQLQKLVLSSHQMGFELML